jgi:SAM-dependent methyltransferase
MKIVVAQFWTKNLSYTKYTKEINEKYCKEKDYIYHIESNDEKIKNSITGRAFTWYKPKFLLEVFEIYNPDYVLFLDADAIVSDTSYRIEDFIDVDYDCVVTKDHGPSRMNAGVLLFKNSDWSKSFLQRWWDVSDELRGPNDQPNGFYNNGLWHDQTCFGHLYDKEDYNSKIKIIDNKVLNGRVFRDITNKNFIFHAFAYGLMRNRTLDTAYYSIFNIIKPESDEIIDMVDHYMTDKHHEHNFFNLIYSDLFKELKNDVKKFVEIGVYDGESIRLWRDYFLNAEIYGLDITPENADNRLGSIKRDRLNLLKMDQSNLEDISLFCSQHNDIDVILDDGSHRMFDQQITLSKMFRSLKPGGIFIIEDLHTSLEVVIPEKYWCGWGDPNKTITLNMLKDFQNNGKIISDYMSDEDMKYLNDNIELVEIYQSKPDWSITSVIKKKLND